MNSEKPASTPEVDELLRKLEKDAMASGYHLNPDLEFTRALVEGLLINERRYGYPSCPCRLASGARDKDIDIICPCNYRDPDLDEHGSCYCALYVSSEIARGEAKAKSIPERRPPESKRVSSVSPETKPSTIPAGLPFPVWRCSVCGYLCAREQPPEVCPICKVKKERFSRFF